MCAVLARPDGPSYLWSDCLFAGAGRGRGTRKGLEEEVEVGYKITEASWTVVIPVGARLIRDFVPPVQKAAELIMVFR